jgi:hypothetical protein
VTDLHDLGLAYRKAKVDLYYSSHASLEAIADYESKLHENLTALLIKLQAEDESWVTKPEFTGSWTLATKSVDMRHWDRYRQNHRNDMVFSSPNEEWEHICSLLERDNPPQKPQAIFRVMAQCSLDFHVLSTLWMMKVGHQFDAKLTTCSYGNRLTLAHDGKGINELSLGSFKPYLKPFRDWRDNGIKTMHTALNAGKRIVALTADIGSFYHELNPSFMLDPTFLVEVLDLKLTDAEDIKLHRLFIHALRAWADSTPLKKGLPVGLPASAVVANVALAELDQIVERQLAPLYYGRYVDDILLVMENGADFRSTNQLWDWLFARFGGRLKWVDFQEDNQVGFQPKYLQDSRICFANSKSKVFILAGEPGRALVDAISQQIRERASEWRAMPRLPHSPDHAGTDLLAATQSNGEAAENLRNADGLTMRRASFAIRMRDLEAYERDLLPEAWQAHRRAFLQAFTRHVLVLPRFFDLAIYLPRVIQLATACEDFEALRKILRALEQLDTQLTQHCDLDIKAYPTSSKPSPIELIIVWRKQLYATIRESISAAFPPRLSQHGKEAWNTYMGSYTPAFPDVKIDWDMSTQSLQAKQARLFSFDLAHMPFRFIGLPKEMVAQRGIPAKRTVLHCLKAGELLPPAVCDGTQYLTQWIGVTSELAHGLLFATRPYSLPELFILNRSAYDPEARATMKAVVLAVRGFRLSEAAPSFDKHGVLQISDAQPQRRYGIAVSSWKTQMASWTASVMRMTDPDVERYARLCRLLDGVIAQPRHSRYLVLPELALPAHWFIRIARKLQGRGISLIAGIEYLHAPRAQVRNQVWAALSHDGLGFPSLMIYRQDKQRPALHEEQELQRLAGLEMKPEKIWKTPPILQHGDIRFAFLICSELTNISHRSALRGKVDVLFVPEWNQDTETFNALVESAALDIHAYIVQCNDRQYGDSRIRAPFKESWQRDVLRVKGGVTDYCVIGEIDVQALRQFQSSFRSPTKPFKPVPDGFEIDFSRRVLPNGEC